MFPDESYVKVLGQQSLWNLAFRDSADLVSYTDRTAILSGDEHRNREFFNYSILQKKWQLKESCRLSTF